jgi:nicotinate-nucleotide--dimethylbenzimidazole phosphoribosyltransferase
VSAWLQEAIGSPDRDCFEQALQRQAELTKPPGSLGRLEWLAASLAAMQRSARPNLERVQISVFAADHGVVAEGVSAFPQEVTAEMVRNFARGGAAISVLARLNRCKLEVVNAGTATPLEPLDGVLDQRVGPGTANIAVQPAMSEQQLEEALGLGKAAVDRAVDSGAQLFVGAEMGIGNTSAAAALGCALLGLPATELVGAGTGLDSAGITHKTAVVQRALARCEAQTPLQALRQLGGFEIAALCGASLRCAQSGIPLLVDGFISSVATLAAWKYRPEILPWHLFAHRSNEFGHGRVLESMEATPLLDLGMRLGEGSGAAVALPLLRSALALHGEMATFSEASVSS